MSTKAGGEGFAQERVEENFANTRGLRDRISSRPRDAIAGALALLAIVAAVLLMSLQENFGSERTVLARMLSILVFVFAPASLAALYSLFFERSRVYGCIDLVLAFLVFRKQPFAWHWVEMYWPIACAFILFCAAVRVLEQRAKR